MGLPTNNQVAVFACSGQSCGSTSVAVINTPNPDLPGGGFGTSLDWKDNIIAVGLVNSNTSSIKNIKRIILNLFFFKKNRHLSV